MATAKKKVKSSSPALEKQVEKLARSTQSQFENIEKRDELFLEQFKNINFRLSEIGESLKERSRSEANQDLEIMDLDLRVKNIERKSGISR